MMQFAFIDDTLEFAKKSDLELNRYMSHAADC